MQLVYCHQKKIICDWNRRTDCYLDGQLWMEYSRSCNQYICQTSNIDLFAKVVIVLKSLNVFEKSSILDVWNGTKYASDFTTV